MPKTFQFDGKKWNRILFEGPQGPQGPAGKDAIIPDTEEIVNDIEKELPQLGEKIRDGLELLQGDERLDKSAIKGIEEIEKLAKSKPTSVGGSGMTRNFYQLFDVPQSYAGESGKVVKVKTTEDGLEFGTASSGSGDLTLSYASAVFVPYTNANDNVDLGAYSLTATGLLGTLTGNVIGNASGLYGTPTLPNGTLATTQSPNDNSTKLATTAYADAAAGGGGASLSLNNIASVGASASINPGASVVNDLGTATLLWHNVYAENIGATGTRAIGWFDTLTVTNPVVANLSGTATMADTAVTAILVNSATTATIANTAVNALLANSVSTATISDTAVNSLLLNGVLPSGYALTGQQFYVGTTQIAINRASDPLTLAGITLTTPDLGTPTALVLTNATGTAAANITGVANTAILANTAVLANSASTAVMANTAVNSLLLNGVAPSGYALVGQEMYIGTTATNINRTSAAQTLAGITLTTPNIGTPSAGVITNLTGTATNIGLITPTLTNADIVSSDLGTPTALVLTNASGTATSIKLETPTLVSPTATNPTLIAPALGTPASGTLTNCTGLPAASVVAGTLAAGMTTSDHGTATSPELVSVVYGTGDPPAASSVPEGTLFIQYTA